MRFENHTFKKFFIYSTLKPILTEFLMDLSFCSVKAATEYSVKAGTKYSVHTS